MPSSNSRTEKKTRIRGLPPRLILSRRQDASGSFPPIKRTAVDNRTGGYRVSFNDSKFIPFNIPVSDARITINATVDPTVVYEEYTVSVVAATDVTVTYLTSFADTPPMVVITELASTDSEENIKAFITNSSVFGFTAGFSAPFTGTLSYRAINDPSPGTPHLVERVPLHPGSYSKVVTKTTNWFYPDIGFEITFNDFGEVPPTNYITLTDIGLSNADTETFVMSAGSNFISITGSSVPTGDMEIPYIPVSYMGVDDNVGGSGVSVRGLVFPLRMTPEQAAASLAPEDYIELYKQPYLSGGVLVNVPIVASGSMTRTVSDKFVSFTPGQDLQPFVDFNNPAVDAKLSDNSFYATGSAVETTGEGFQQPLWSKTKIEIPLDVSTEVTFGQSTYKYQDLLMAYYDHAQKTFVPIGDNRTNAQLLNYDLSTNTTEYFASKSIGFSPSTYGHFGNGALEAQAARLFATPVNSFGFPYDAKRYAVPGNNPNTVSAINTNKNMLFSLENVLAEPFLLEKIVLEFTGAMSSSGMDDSGFCAMSTFFILNQTNTSFVSQRKAYTAFQLASIPPAPERPLPGYTYTIDTGTVGMDLVSYLQVAALTSSLVSDPFVSPLRPQFERDLNIYQEATKPVNLSYGLNPNFGYAGSFVASASVRSPTAYNFSNIFRDWATIGITQFITWHWLDNRYGGRKSLLEPCARNWKELLPAQNPAEALTITGSFIGTGSYTLITQDRTFTDNPYVLFPSDKLIFGWQAPLASVSGSISGDVGDGPQLHFPVGPGKVVLYGSSLRFNPDTNQLEEYHDTLNQLLTSISINEGIP